jgi:hypothetical protein
LVLGCASLLFCFVGLRSCRSFQDVVASDGLLHGLAYLMPMLCVGLAPGIAGIMAGILGVRHRGRSRGLAIAGLVFCGAVVAVTLFVVVFWTVLGLSLVRGQGG